MSQETLGLVYLRDGFTILTLDTLFKIFLNGVLSDKISR